MQFMHLPVGIAIDEVLRLIRRNHHISQLIGRRQRNQPIKIRLHIQTVQRQALQAHFRETRVFAVSHLREKRGLLFASSTPGEIVW